MVATGLVRGVSGVVSNDIQVSGLVSQEFPESRWREAILFYLFGIWSGRQSVMYRPKISFGSVTLRLDSDEGKYEAYGTPPEELTSTLRFRADEKLFVDTGRQADVEVALVRFVKNDQIKLLILWLPQLRVFFTLWKKSRRSQYGCCLTDPRAWNANGPVL